jgi:flagellar biosynthesis protein FliP
VKLELTEGMFQDAPSRVLFGFIFFLTLYVTQPISRNAAQKCVETSSVDYTSNYIMDSA